MKLGVVLLTNIHEGNNQKGALTKDTELDTKSIYGDQKSSRIDQHGRYSRRACGFKRPQW
jgi:hypothetical protein